MHQSQREQFKFELCEDKFQITIRVNLTLQLNSSFFLSYTNTLPQWGEKEIVITFPDQKYAEAKKWLFWELLCLSRYIKIMNYLYKLALF